MDLTQLVTYRFSPPINRGEVRAILEYLDGETDLMWVGDKGLTSYTPKGDEIYGLSVHHDGVRNHNNGSNWTAESADEDMRGDKIVDGREFFGLNDDKGQMDKFFFESDSDWGFMDEIVPRPRDGEWTETNLESILEDHYILFGTDNSDLDEYDYKVTHIKGGLCDARDIVNDPTVIECCISWDVGLEETMSMSYDLATVVRFFNHEDWYIGEITPKNKTIKENKDSDWDWMDDINIKTSWANGWTEDILETLLKDSKILFHIDDSEYMLTPAEDGLCRNISKSSLCVSWDFDGNNGGGSTSYPSSQIVRYFNGDIGDWVVDGVVPKYETNSEPLKENSEDPDWDFMKEIPDVELGDDFTEDDVCFGADENDDCKVSIGGNGSSLTFNYSYDDFIDDFYDGDDDWVFDSLIKSGGTHEEGGDGYDMDSEEMNYIGGWLHDVDVAKFEEVLNSSSVIQLLEDSVKGFDPNQTELNYGYHHNRRSDNKAELFDILKNYKKDGKISIRNYDDTQEFRELEYLCNLIYKGRWDWGDFESESLHDLSYYQELNRWRNVNSEYHHILDTNNMGITYDGGYGYGYGNGTDTVSLTVPYPFHGDHSITDIKHGVVSLLERGWQDSFYEEYDQEGAGEDIQEAFKRMIEKLDEAVTELEEDDALYEGVFGISPDVERELQARSEKDREEEDIEVRTDPSKGVIRPSRTVMDNVCSRQKICDEQGPITFGQLRGIITSAQNKSLGLDIGGGIFKSFIRLLPFFLPQIALGAAIGSSIRAINKVIKPTIEGTRGYKRWWGKMVMSVMNLAEGELGTSDPLSKVFFISDGLLDMMDRKYQLKFSRYIAELADSKPDNEMVPEYFVENELRRWINEKFLLDPPLEPKF